jgi:RHH-type rel operon transcriptional repressor/antitoxin RelB
MVLNIRIDEKLDRKLSELAKRHKRTKSFYVREAMDMFLDDIADYEEALQRSMDPSAKYISGHEIRKRLGL